MSARARARVGGRASERACAQPRSGAPGHLRVAAATVDRADERTRLHAQQASQRERASRRSSNPRAEDVRRARTGRARRGRRKGLGELDEPGPRPRRESAKIPPGEVTSRTGAGPDSGSTNEAPGADVVSMRHRGRTAAARRRRLHPRASPRSRVDRDLGVEIDPRKPRACESPRLRVRSSRLAGLEHAQVVAVAACVGRSVSHPLATTTTSSHGTRVGKAGFERVAITAASLCRRYDEETGNARPQAARMRPRRKDRDHMSVDLGHHMEHGQDEGLLREEVRLRQLNVRVAGVRRSRCGGHDAASRRRCHPPRNWARDVRCARWENRGSTDQ